MSIGNRKIVLINVISSGGQVVLIGVVYFLLYKFLLKQVGVELLGVWSVVMATSSIANLANFGLGASVVRFVALYSKENSFEKINKLIFTSTIFIGGIFLLLSAIFWVCSSFLLKQAIEPKYISVSIDILPYSILCLIINAVSSVYTSVLDGLQKNYVRSVVYTISAVVLLIFSFSLTKRNSLMGVVIAQVIQSLFTLIGCLFFVIRTTKYNPFKLLWSSTIFKEIMGYGLKFQGVSLLAMFNEPVTKLFLAKFGGLNITGYYEMASRLISQLRGVIVSANQSLIPLMVKSSQKTDSSATENNKVYKMSFFGVMTISLVILTFPVLADGIIAKIWIGHYEPVFSRIFFLLSLASYVNLLAAPTYFALLAEGDMKPLLLSQIITSTLNILFALGLSHFIGGFGVIYSWLFALIAGSVFLIFNYLKKINIHITKIFSKDLLLLFLPICILFIFKFIFQRYFSSSIVGEILISIVAFVIFFANLLFYRVKFKANNLSFL